MMLSGPAQTGKTIAALCLLDYLAREYQGAQLTILRQVRADMNGTVLQVFRDRILTKPTSDGIRVVPYGGKDPDWYDYSNGSRIWIGGMDRPGAALSGERDAIYFNQAEESKLEAWETISTRTTGRGGHMRDKDGVPFGMLFGDCNPGPPTHWIWSQHLAGTLVFFESRHVDNPALFDQETGAITPEGERTLAQLERLTGYRRARLYEGRWVQAEGVVFDTWSDDENVTEAAEYQPNAGDVYLAIDDGYSAGSAIDTRGLDPHTHRYVADAHPRVFLFCQLMANGDLNVFYEDYACLKLSDKHIKEIQELPYPVPVLAVHGPGQAEIRGRLAQAGIPFRQSKANVDESIKELQGWIAADENGHRRIHVHPRCRHLRGEMVAYAYEPGSNKPVKAFDHGPDALRGLCWTLRYQR